MRLDEMTFKPTVYVSITHAELALIIKCSREHYDHTCRDASREDKDWAKQGFLVGYVKSKRFDRPGTRRPVRMEWREIDLMAKITEGAWYLKDKEREQGIKIHWELARLLRTLSAQNPKARLFKAWEPVPVKRTRNIKQGAGGQPA